MTIKAILLSLALLAPTLLGQHLAFSRASNGTNSITIPSGEAWQVANWFAFGTGEYFSIQIGGGVLYFYGTSSSVRTLENPSYPIGLILLGPTTINNLNYGANSAYDYYLVLKKLSNSQPQGLVSATSVVIPQSATGDVDVKLEQSADNVTWTECLPGTYNSSTVKRFFRLRAVEK